MLELLASHDESLIDWSHIDWLTYQDQDQISSPPSALPPPSRQQPSILWSVVNFSMAEEATSSQLAGDWLALCRSRAGCIESNCFASIEDLWSHWESDCGSPQTSALVVLWDSGEREDPELDWQCCMTDMQARQTPAQLGSVKAIIIRAALCLMVSVKIVEGEGQTGPPLSLSHQNKVNTLIL